MPIGCVEILSFDRKVLIPHHPLYVAAAPLAGFLIFSRLGSAFAKPFALGFSWYRMLGRAVAGVALLALIARLAFCMCTPFPLALASIAPAGYRLRALGMGLETVDGTGRITTGRPGGFAPWTPKGSERKRAEGY